MKPTILRTNATAVTRFLSKIHASLEPGESLCSCKIFDCGAGGPIPPLAIFAEQGMEAHGIDISETQLAKAKAFAQQISLPIHLQSGDMRQIPYEDGTFDYVYEHFSMCHLSKADTAMAIEEMQRVLKPGGLAFLGVISQDCWPLSFYGEERLPGERWMVEGGDERRHSLFSDAEANALVSSWNIKSKERSVFHVGGAGLSKDEWKALHLEAPEPCSLDEWMARYPERIDRCRYVHTYFYLEKPPA